MPQQLNISYDPNPKQREAHALSAKYRGFCGGWGNGKTTWGCVEFFTRLLEFPGTNSMVFRKTRPELKGTTWDMMLNGDNKEDGGWQGIPRELIRTNNKSDLYIELTNGSRIHGAPLDDIKKIENYNLGLWWIDQAEEIGQDFFIKLNGRLRQHRAPREGLLTFNPDGHNWLWKRFIDPSRPVRWLQLYQAVEATTFDNPKLPQDYMDQFEGLPEHWLQRYLHGSHEVFVGQIFTDWHEEIHVIEPFAIPSHWERWMCFDPGIRHEAAATWCTRDPLGNVYYYRELLQTDKDVAWWATTINEAEIEYDIGGPDEEVYRRLIGPESLQRSQTDGKTVHSLFFENDLNFEIADRDPAARISRITEYLRPKADHMNPWTRVKPSPRLFVFKTCSKLTEYLPQYRWRPVRSTSMVEEDPPEKVRKKDDHNIDNLGHILVALDDLPEVDEESRSVRTREDEWVAKHYEDAIEQANRTSPYTPRVNNRPEEVAV